MTQLLSKHKRMGRHKHITDRTNNFSEGWNNRLPAARRTQSSGSMAFDRVFPSGSVGRGHQTLAASPRTAACTARPSLHPAATGEATEAVPCVSIRDGGNDIAHFLRAVGHTVRLCKE